MQISVRLPIVDPTALQPLTKCPLKNRRSNRPCTGAQFKSHQLRYRKAMRDVRHCQVAGQRARRLRKQWLTQLHGKIKMPGLDWTHVKINGGNAGWRWQRQF